MGHRQKKNPKKTDNTGNANNANDEGDHQLVASDKTPSTEFKTLKNRSAEKLKSSPLNTLLCVKKRSTKQLNSKATGFKSKD